MIVIRARMRLTRSTAVTMMTVTTMETKMRMTVRTTAMMKTITRKLLRMPTFSVFFHNEVTAYANLAPAARKLLRPHPPRQKQPAPPLPLPHRRRLVWLPPPLSRRQLLRPQRLERTRLSLLSAAPVSPRLAAARARASLLRAAQALLLSAVYSHPPSTLLV